MALERKTNLGTIEIVPEVIETISGEAAMDCYGLVGMVSQKYVQDGIQQLLRKDNFRKGVVLRQLDNGYEIDMYIVVQYGTKISEVAHNVQRKVRYTLEEMLQMEVGAVNVYVQSVAVD